MRKLGVRRNHKIENRPTQEADATSWPGLKHVQPKEGRKELAPRGIKFRYRRRDTAIRGEREHAVPKRGARERQIPRAIFLCFLFLFIPSSRCSRRVFAPWTRRESPMVYNRERQPHNQLRLRMAIRMTGEPVHGASGVLCVCVCCFCFLFLKFKV